jgi:hypothetical protein
LYLLGPAVGLDLGGVQALSRSLYGSMIPEDAAAEFFGFYSVFSKFAAIWGPLVFALVSNSTGSGRPAMLSIGGFFAVGFVLLSRLDVDKARSVRDTLISPSKRHDLNYIRLRPQLSAHKQCSRADPSPTILDNIKHADRVDPIRWSRLLSAPTRPPSSVSWLKTGQLRSVPPVRRFVGSPSFLSWHSKSGASESD